MLLRVGELLARVAVELFNDSTTDIELRGCSSFSSGASSDSVRISQFSSTDSALSLSRARSLPLRLKSRRERLPLFG